MDDTSNPNEPAQPPKERSLYNVRGNEAADHANLSEDQKRWQMPKEGIIEPSAEGLDAYATAPGEKTPEVSDEVRRWQMPKEERIDTESIPSGNLYSLGSSDSPTDSAEVRSWQTPADETLKAPMSGELYAVSDKNDLPEQRGPDLRVLFADSKVDQGELYAVGAQDAAGVPSPKTELPPSISPASAESAGEVYGVSATPENFYASDVKNPGRTYDTPDEAYGTIAGKRDLEGDLSVDTIYGRRMERDRTGMFDPPKPKPYDEPEIEKSPLPSRPFVKGVFRPFFAPAFLLRLLMLTIAATVPFYLGIWFFSRVADDLAEFQRTLPVEQYSVDSGASNRFAQWLSNPKAEKFLACLYEDRLVLFFVCLVWGVFAVPYFLQVFTATAAGDDRIDEWPDSSMMGGIIYFLWLTGLVFAAGIPGWIVFGLLGMSELGFAVGTIALTPIFFLSCMEKDSFFALISTNVLRSFSTLGGYWRRFYLLSITLYLIGVFGFCSILWNVVWLEEERKPSVALAALLASILFSVLPVVYLRYLGRLAWVIQENSAKRTKTKRKKGKKNAAPNNKNGDRYSGARRDFDDDDDTDDDEPSRPATGSFSLPPNRRDAMRHLAAIPEPAPEKPKTKKWKREET